MLKLLALCHAAARSAALPARRAAAAGARRGRVARGLGAHSLTIMTVMLSEIQDENASS